MQLDADQFDQIVAALVGERGGLYRDRATVITAAEAELIVALAQLAMAADAVDDPDEVAVFDAITARVYAIAQMATTPPSLAPLADASARLQLAETHAAQLRDTPAAPLAYAVVFAITIADLDLDPAESDLLETLRDALGLDDDEADRISTVVATIATPKE